MRTRLESKQLTIGGMTCVSCQNKIERKLKNTAGVKNVRVNYNTGIVRISYDSDIILLKDISEIIKKMDYQVLTEKEKREPNLRRVTGILLLIVVLYALLQQFGVLNLFVPSKLADSKMGYGMLFVIGLITSIHCIAMCGGINLSQCIPHGDKTAKKKSWFGAYDAALFYNLGRVFSYTIIGFILGFLGMLFGVIDSSAGLPVMAQGILKFIAGLIMVIMGMNLLGIFPWLRKFQPKMPKVFARKISQEKLRNKSPFIVGLLNGLMPCGPLQSMQIVALASGNPFAGALSMLFFSLGTVPLMLGLGSIVSALGKKFTQKVLSVGAVLVVVLGLAMLSQGGSLSGFLPPERLLAILVALCVVGIVSSIRFRKSSQKIISTVAAFGLVTAVFVTWQTGIFERSVSDTREITIIDGKQVVTSMLSSGSYPNIAVQAGTPVKWIINAPQGSINGCNNRMNIQEYGFADYSFQIGENVLEFTPEKAGTFQYSCWMGMIHGSITVMETGVAADS